MWKNINRLSTTINQALLLSPELCTQQQLRTTFVLKRRNPPMLHRKGAVPKRLKPKQFIYDLVQDTDILKQADLEVILTSYVKGLGDIGQRVSVRPSFAYKHLLLPGLAVYASPENLKKYEDVDCSDQKSHSSATAALIAGALSRLKLSVVMNKEIAWTLQPWHIKTSFRKCGFHVPDDCITLPSKLIKGPNLDLENKVFYVTVTINKTEKAEVLCRIHHWSTGIRERLPHIREFWRLPPEPIFSEDIEKLASLDKPSE